MLNAALVLFLYLAMLVTAASAVQLLSSPVPQPTLHGQALFWGSLVLSVLLMAVGVVRRMPFSIAGRRRAAGWQWALGGLLLLSVGLSALLAPWQLPDGGMGEAFVAMSRHPLCLLLLLVVGPFTEELVFREGIVRNLVRSGYRPLTACLVASLLFALVHGNLAQALPAFVLGLALGLLYLRTGDLRLCLPAHVLNNALALLALRFPVVESSASGLPVPLLVGGGLLLAVLGTAALWRGVGRRIPSAPLG